MKFFIPIILTTFFLIAQCDNFQNPGPCNNQQDCQWYGACGVCVDAVEAVCPDETFLDVSQFPGAGGNYPDPSLDVYCEDDMIHVLSNGIPHYNFVQITPNNLQAQNYHWEIPRFPVDNGQNNTIPLLGTVGIAVNGLPFFGPNEAANPHPYGDPVYNGIMDYCMGHTAQQGVYHYHAMLVECLSDGVSEDEPSPILGYADDGYPIYGPVGCADAECSELIEYQSGWVQTGDPTTYAWDNHEYQASNEPNVLDECNGHVGPNGYYHYHATSTFPYILGCFHGTSGQSGNGPNPGDVIAGDLNADNLMNILDVILLVNVVLDTEFSVTGDLNADCEVNILDIVSLVNEILSV